MERDDVIAQLNAAGIEFDGRLSTEKLAAKLPGDEPEIQAVPAQNAPGGMVMCVILRDTWDEKSVRQPKGTEVALPIHSALDLIEAGTVSQKK